MALLSYPCYHLSQLGQQIVQFYPVAAIWPKGMYLKPFFGRDIFAPYNTYLYFSIIFIFKQDLLFISWKNFYVNGYFSIFYISLVLIFFAAYREIICQCQVYKKEPSLPPNFSYNIWISPSIVIYKGTSSLFLMIIHKE